MISPALIEDYRLKFTRNHNLVIIFNHFIVASLSDSKILIRFSTVLAELKSVLSSAKIVSRCDLYKIEKSLKKASNEIDPKCSSDGSPDIFLGKLLSILVSLRHGSLF